MDNLLKKHAKSFYWASFFLSKKILKKSAILYNFCRTLDDIADNKGDLKHKKEKFLKFKEDFLNKNFQNLIVSDMYSIIETEKIKKKVILDLFDGIEMDLQENVNINSKKDLLIYSYRVAGTVGLMMSKILKVKDKEALKGAIHLGIAMQLTNIARDVNEDKDSNRKYINAEFSSIIQTLKDAEFFYKISFSSISKIPLRSRFAVIVARRLYKKIGDHILRHKDIQNYNNAGKIYVPFASKLNETLLSIFDFLKLFFVSNINCDNDEYHGILAKEINFNERV